MGQLYDYTAHTREQDGGGYPSIVVHVPDQLAPQV
jgi:hypothetical protein